MKLNLNKTYKGKSLRNSLKQSYFIERGNDYFSVENNIMFYPVSYFSRKEL